jgi:hypothetical protein
MSETTTTPTPTEPHHDVREEWAARLQAADVGVDFPWLTEDGCDVWHEQSEAAQEHYRNLLRVALSAGLQIPPAAAVSAAATASGQNRSETATVLAKREALDATGLPERFRFSREVYGDVADDATRVLLALTDGGHGDQPSDYLRWVSITAAQALATRPAPSVSAAASDERELVGHLDRFIADCAAEGVEKGVLSVEWAGRLRAALAARPAPVVNAADVDVREALLERVAAAVDAATRLGEEYFAAIESEASRIGMGTRHWSAVVAVDAVLAALGLTAADDEGGQE